MNTEDQDQQFAKLQQLLKLKRHEQPHPRYFNDFSGQVLSRIRAGRNGGRFETAGDFLRRIPWLRRLWRQLEARPALAGVIAASVCGLLGIGVFFMEESTPQNLNLLAGEGNNAGENHPAPPPALGNNFAALTAAPQLASSTNISPFPTGSNLFEHMPTLQTMPASGGAPLFPR